MKEKRQKREPTDFTAWLKREVKKLKSKGLFKEAASIEIAFNAPTGKLAKVFNEIRDKRLAEYGQNLSLAEVISIFFDSVLIFPLPQKGPALILKSWGPRANQVKVSIKQPEFDFFPVQCSDYLVVYNGEIYGHEFPGILTKNYPEGYLIDLLFYHVLPLPEGVNEFPLRLLVEPQEKLIFRAKYITAVRKELKAIGLFIPGTGKSKPTPNEMESKRAMFIIKNYEQSLKKKKPMSVDELYFAWQDEVYDIPGLDDKTREKYVGSRPTIGRIVKIVNNRRNFIKQYGVAPISFRKDLKKK